MADHTEIEWTDATWNPITGCSIVSPGCTHCYAMVLAGTRLKNHESRSGLTKQVNGNHVWTGEVRFNAQWLDQPLRWTKPRKIFVCAHGDLFAEGVPDEWIDQVFAVMALAPQHTFQVLTKRPKRMQEYVRALFLRSGTVACHAAWSSRGAQDPDGIYAQVSKAVRTHLPNVWLGVSVEDQRRADERRDMLACLAAEGWTTWVSYEPALGPIDWRSWEFLEWLVSGGESGPDARPSHPDWHRAARDFCAAYGIPYLFKQWGEYAPRRAAEPGDQVDARKALIVRPDGGITSGLLPYPDAWIMDKVGKRRAGRLLDGVEHNAFPQQREAR